MANPYLIGLTIKNSSGTAVPNVSVVGRIESTAESATKITDSSGRVIFNLANTTDFPSTYTVGDVFTYHITYGGYVTYGTHIVTSGGGWTSNVTLSTTTSAESNTLRYFTFQNFLDFFHLVSDETDAENGVDEDQISMIGQMVETNIDNDTGLVFDTNGGSYYSKTEYIDTDENTQIYHLTYLPVYSITSVYVTSSSEDDAPDYTNNTSLWTSITEGIDFVVDKGDNGIGRIQITNSSYYPITRKWGLYVSYYQGRSSVPYDIKLLAIVETGLKALGAAVVKSKIVGSEKDTGDMTWFDNFRNRIIKKYSSQAIMNPT